MSNYAGPKISKDPNLVLNIDAANVKSYPAGQDPYVNNVSLMLDGESLNDSSQNGFTITNSNVVVSSTQYKYGSSSLYFNGSAYMTYSPGASVAFGTSDFTVEGWMYPTTLPTDQYIFDFRNSSQTNAPAIGFGLNGVSFHGRFGWYTGSVIIETTSTTPVAASGWTHFAYCRTSSNGSGFLSVNGTVVASGADARNYTVSPTTSYIGTRYNISSRFTGYFDDIRITKGTARYGSSNFTPPDAPFSLPRRLTDLTQNKAVGAMSNCTFRSGNQGSIVFNGTSSVIYYPSNSIYSFGTGDFALESYCQVNLLTNSRPIAQNDAVGSSTNNKWWWAYDATAAGLRFGRHFTATYSSCAWTPVSGQWYHIATTRVSNLMYFYINGVSQSVTNQTSMSGVSFSQNGLSVGGLSTPYYLNGNIAVFRMYNRGLTATEVYNNYIANRGRFGI